MTGVDEVLPVPPEPAEPAKPSSRKVADRPHRWTIALGIIAILISCFSMFFSHQSVQETRENRKINEITSRAYLKVSSTLLDARTLYKHENPKFRQVIAYVVVTNTGRSAAKNVRVEYALLSHNKNEPNTRVDGAIGRAAHFQQMVPGASETIRFGLPVLVKNNAVDLTDGQFTLNVLLIYNDGLHSGDKLEDSTVCGNKPEKPGGALVSLYYCVNFIGGVPTSESPLKP